MRQNDIKAVGRLTFIRRMNKDKTFLNVEFRAFEKFNNKHLILLSNIAELLQLNVTLFVLFLVCYYGSLYVLSVFRWLVTCCFHCPRYLGLGSMGNVCCRKIKPEAMG